MADITLRDVVRAIPAGTPRHPVDVFAAMVPEADPALLADLRRHCDQPVSVPPPPMAALLARLAREVQVHAYFDDHGQPRSDVRLSVSASVPGHLTDPVEAMVALLVGLS